MPYRSITFCLIVEENQAEGVIEEMECLIDGLVLKNIAVFDTDVKTVTLYDVKDAQAVKDEMATLKTS
jgi:hypothetical protein